MKRASRILIVAAVALAAAASSGCGESSRSVAARVVDAEGHAVAGAILYAETQRHEEVIDFAWGETGDDGQVRDAAGKPLTIASRHGARLALAVFATGKQPLVVYDAGGRLVADGLDLPLQNLRPVGERWEPRLAQLAFPFEADARLAARATQPACAALRRAFAGGYRALDDPDQLVLPREKARHDALRRLMEAAGDAVSAGGPSPESAR